MLDICMRGMGFSDIDITKIRNNYVLKKYSELTLYNKINDIFCYLNLYGYTKKEIIGITSIFPSLYCFSLDMLKKRIKSIAELGYSREEIIKMTVKCPGLFGKDINDLRRKKRFYDQIGIGDVIVNNAFYLTQNIELSYARYVFFYKLGIKIDRVNAKMLFMKQENFINKYGKTNKQLMTLYNCNEHLENKNAKVKARS